MGSFERTYARLPVWGQHVAVSAYGYYWRWLRFGPGYGSAVREFKSREGFSTKRWRAWERDSLAPLLRIAARSVPYYAESWNAGQKSSAAKGDLVGLPLLEKEPIRADPRAFVRRDERPFRELIFHTSGSTGTPIASIWTVRELRSSLALREVRSANWAGVSFDEPRATFSGRLAEPDPDSKGPFHRFNLAEHQVYFSAFHLKPENARQYVDALRDHRIRWLTGYAVSWYLLARFVLEQGLKPPPLAAVITTSEKVTRPMRDAMQKAYGCRVFEEYSTVENAVFAGECALGRLHVSPDAARVEILRPDGSPCAPGEVGEVVTTNLMRTYQPFIRFRLGDLAAWDGEACPCGREMPVIKEVVGRIEDVVVGPDGRQMVRFHGIFVDMPHVREGQIIQEALDRVRVKIVTAPGYGVDDELEITHRIKARLTDAMNVAVEPVESITRTKAGKFQAVLSLLDGGKRACVERTGLEESDNLGLAQRPS